MPPFSFREPRSSITVLWFGNTVYCILLRRGEGLFDLSSLSAGLVGGALLLMTPL